MSFALPVIEVASAALGLLIAFASGRIMRSAETGETETKAHKFLQELSHSDRWVEFEKSRLRVMLEDREISNKEWIEILSVLEAVSEEISASKIVAPVASEFLVRPPRSKKLLVSDMLEEVAGLAKT